MKPRALLTLLPLLLAGCGLFGSKQQPSAYTSAPDYPGLANKSVALVIYVPRSIGYEYTGAREEITNFIVADMREHLPTTQLIAPREIMNFQDDTLNWTSLSLQDLGRHFSADKLLFVSVVDYATRPAAGYANMQGRLRASCQLLDCGKDASPSPEWHGVLESRWPPDRPLEPTQNNETAVRLRVLESFADNLVHCFYTGPRFDSQMPG